MQFNTTSKKSSLVLIVSELITFNPSMGFNVITMGKKVTVGLGVTRNKSTGVKSHIIDIDKKMNILFN